MRVALVADVHGNIDALDAVLAHLDALGVRRVFALGDLVGRGPEPGEVVARLRQRDISSIRGNWDDWVAGGAGWDARPKRKMWVLAARARMGPAELAYLATLPGELSLDLGGHRVLLVHGSPRSMMELLGPETPDAVLAEALAEARADVVALGHSHKPFVRRLGGRLVVNCGTVGYSFDGDPRASLALVELGKEPRAELHRVPYRLDRHLARMQALVADGVLPPSAVLRHRRALLGDEPGPPPRLGTAARGAERALAILAAPARALCQDERHTTLAQRVIDGEDPSEEQVRALLLAIELLRGALELAAPLLKPRRTQRLLRALCALSERALRLGAEVGAAADPARPRIRLRRRGRRLARLLTPPAALELGLAILALALRAVDDGADLIPRSARERAALEAARQEGDVERQALEAALAATLHQSEG